MTTLRQFSEKEISFFRYLARQDYLRQQRTILRDREEALQRERAVVRERDVVLQSLREKEAALQEKDAALQGKDAEIVRLNALLSSVSTVNIAPSP